jgi:chromosome segregation ATPase
MAAKMRGEKELAQPYLRKHKRQPPDPPLTVPKIEFDPNNPTLTQSELQFSHEVISTQHSRIADMGAEITNLRKQVADGVTSARQTAAYLEREMGLKERRARQLEAEVDEKNREKERIAATLKKDLQLELREQKSRFDSVELEIRREVAELKEENQQLLHFRSEQKKLGQEVQDLRRKEAVLQEEKELFERECNAKFAEAKENLETDYRKSLEAAQLEAKVVAKRELSEEVRAQQAQREKYKNELDLHEHWRAKYFEEREELRAEAKQLRIDNALLKDRLAEMAKQSQECTQHNSTLFDTCKALEHRVNQLTAELQAAKKFLEENEGAPARETASWRKDVQRNSTILKLKRAARDMLEHRSMVEQFLGEALRDCADEFRAAKKMYGAEASAVTISGLTWEERDALLAQAFEKVQEHRAVMLKDSQIIKRCLQDIE